MSGKGLIRIVDIVKNYHMGEIIVPALRGITLTLNEGDFLVITGRNGSGKSTLMHQLGLLDQPDSGEIHLNGDNVTSMPERKRTELRLKSLGYIFQEFALIPELTALENVMLPAMMIAKNSACRSKASEMLAMVGLEGKEQHLPAQLSGGEQQRVAIARSMVNDPVVLLADEPTANLDSVSAKEILAIFRRLNREFRRTIAMVTHEQEETSYGNRMIRLADGVVVDEI